MPYVGLVKELNRYHALPEKLGFLGRLLREKHPDIARFSVALYQPVTDMVRTFFTTSDAAEALNAYDYRLRDAGSLNQIALRKNPRIINDLTALIPPRHQGHVNPHTRILLEQGWRASFTAPLLSNDELLGFVFFNSRKLFVFLGDLLDELEIYSQLIAQLIHQEHGLIRNLTAVVRSTLSLCAGRDPETGAHLERMAQYTQLIATQLAPRWVFSDRQIQHLHLFAPLHDLGKLAVPDRLLLKPGKLTSEEFIEMQQHTVRGVELLERVMANHGLEYLPDMQMLKNLVLHHHEKMDGTGYPQGLRGEAIPIEARIVAVADVFDALTSERPYKKPWPMELALQEVQRMAGNHLDPDCVDALILHRQEAEQIFERLCTDRVEV